MLLMELTGSFWRVVAEDLLDGDGLVAIVFLGAGAVGVDVVDIGRLELGICEGRLHGLDRAEAFGVLIGDAESVGRRSIAHHFGEDLRAAFLRMLERFENDHARAFAENEAGAVGIERAAGSAWDLR